MRTHSRLERGLTLRVRAAQYGGAESLLARKEQQPHLFPLSLALKARGCENARQP